MEEIKQNPVFRNIQFSPKIWGVNFQSVAACLGILLFGTMILRAFLGLFLGIVSGAGAAIGFYVFSFWNDNRDKVESEGRRTPLKRVVASYACGTQEVKVR